MAVKHLALYDLSAEKNRRPEGRLLSIERRGIRLSTTS